MIRSSSHSSISQAMPRSCTKSLSALMLIDHSLNGAVIKAAPRWYGDKWVIRSCFGKQGSRKFHPVQAPIQTWIQASLSSFRWYLWNSDCASLTASNSLVHSCTVHLCTLLQFISVPLCDTVPLQYSKRHRLRDTVSLSYH